MTDVIKEIDKLVEEKKSKILTEEEQEKISQIESLLKIKGIFFKLNMDTVIGILDFLEVPHENIKEMYINLTSPEMYKASYIKEYTSIELPKK